MYSQTVSCNIGNNKSIATNANDDETNSSKKTDPGRELLK